jgi:hypothetical protein
MYLNKFKEKNGEGINCFKIEEETKNRYKSVFPEFLIDEWSANGICGFDKGFIWMANPLMFEAILTDWLGGNQDFIAFGRTAFADLFLWNQINEKVYILNSQYGKLIEQGNNIRLFFNFTLSNKDFLVEALDKDIFEKVIEKLGDLQYDECYGYEPILALGGSGESETLNKVKILPYLSILSQIVKIN